MSRSYKKTPVWNDHSSPGTRWAKRQAARAVRRYDRPFASGKAYRKLYCSWNICDYRFYKTKQQALHEWETKEWCRLRYTKEEYIRDWHKYYCSK